MSHSKRNTSLAFFTSYERDSLKSSWGSQSTRLTRDSFLPFGSCQLCLLSPAIDPVCCADGDLFCRECAVENLLAQRKEMKRVKRGEERRREEEEGEREREEEEARRRAVEEFERVQMGLEVKFSSSGAGGSGAKIVGREDGKVFVERTVEDADGESRGKKRKFELDEEELKRIALEERSRARLALDEEKKASKAVLPSFWVPSQTPDTNHKVADKAKQSPTCPASDPNKPHSFSLKSLTTVNFTYDDKSTSSDPSTTSTSTNPTGTKTTTPPTCPSCRKTLTNATKAVLAIPCGHVLCKPCVDKFLRPELRHDRHAHDDGPDPDTVHCYVCDADLTTDPNSASTVDDKDKAKKEKKGKKGKDKDAAPKPGLVPIRSEGTGFAGGGKAVVKREGVAFTV